MAVSNEFSKNETLLPALSRTVINLTAGFDHISTSRKLVLGELTMFVQRRIKVGSKIYLNFICTHNSRRSHLAQIWAQTAAFHYGIPDVVCLSGGTEATAFNPRAVKAMRDIGFGIKQITEVQNPVYEVYFSEEAGPIIAFSKKYDDAYNQCKDFSAIMTCSHADENCPLVLGSSSRIVITYDDPKEFDGTPLEEEMYRERVFQIGREMLYTFSQVKATL